MQTTDVAVIGGGQAGLAMSRCLAGHNLDHVVFERGDIADRWKTRTWDSLRLLTPNWLNTLPGLPYDGDEPDGFMACGEFVARLRRSVPRLMRLLGLEPADVERQLSGVMRDMRVVCAGCADARRSTRSRNGR